MTLHTPLQQKPALLIGVSATALLLVTLIAFFALRKNPTHAPVGEPQSFFTTDDGQTYFPAPTTNLPPFTHNGKEAVAAMVFEVQGKKFINHLERYTPEAQKAITDYNTKLSAAKSDPGPDPFGWINLSAKELKRPGEKSWTRIDAPNAHTILELKLPPGLTGQPTQIFP